jgi:hypothetical protein
MDHSQRIQQLADRVDAVFKILGAALQAEPKPASPGVLGEMQAQCVVYAGFLADVLAGKISIFNPKVLQMTELVSKFCALVESDLEPQQV